MRDFLSEMLYALTSAYSRKDYHNRQRDAPPETNIGKLFSIFAWGLDFVQEQAGLIKLWDNLDNARGSVLDRYGANFGVERFGASDALYRLMIRVKVLAQLSGGDTQTVIDAAADLLGVENDDLLYEDVFPAKIALYVDQLLLDDERLEMIEPIAWAIKRILAAGVGMRLYLRTYRTYRYDMPVSHGAAIGRFYKHRPIGEDRSVSWEVGIGYGGHQKSLFQELPFIGEDRAATEDFVLRHIGYQASSFCNPPVIDKDRMAHTDLPVAHGAHLPPTLTGLPSDVNRAARGRQEGRSGGYVHSRIKPKRIE